MREVWGPYDNVLGGVGSDSAFGTVTGQQKKWFVSSVMSNKQKGHFSDTC